MNLLLYGLLALALMAAVGTGVYKVKEWGADEVRLEWAAANRQAQEKADAERRSREAEGRKAIIALQQAEQEARNYETRWKQAKNALRRSPLAVCPIPLPAPENAAAPIVASPDAGLRLTPAFVLLYDGAWTGADGKPVFGDPAGAAGSAPAPDPVRPEEVLDTHAENAFRCSENARQLGKLIGLIKRLRGE